MRTRLTAYIRTGLLVVAMLGLAHAGAAHMFTAGPPIQG